MREELSDWGLVDDLLVGAGVKKSASYALGLNDNEEKWLWTKPLVKFDVFALFGKKAQHRRCRRYLDINLRV